MFSSKYNNRNGSVVLFIVFTLIIVGETSLTYATIIESASIDNENTGKSEELLRQCKEADEEYNNVTNEVNAKRDEVLHLWKECNKSSYDSWNDSYNLNKKQLELNIAKYKLMETKESNSDSTNEERTVENMEKEKDTASDKYDVTRNRDKENTNKRSKAREDLEELKGNQSRALEKKKNLLL